MYTHTHTHTHTLNSHWPYRMTSSHYYICTLTLYAAALFTPGHANRLHNCPLMVSMLVLFLGQVISVRFHPFFELNQSSV